MRKIIMVVFILIGVIGTGYGVRAVQINAKYPILNNTGDIEKNVVLWQNRGGDVDPTLIKVEHLGKSNTYVAFLKNRTGEIGIAILKEGPNKNLRIHTTSYGKNDAAYYVQYYGVNTNKGNYGIIVGKDPTNKFSFIRAELMGDRFAYTVQVPKKDYFFFVNKLPKENGRKKSANLYLLDEKKQEINY
ncbi:hypothetical protein [Priestia koreensis]|uniref:hypothetical protein n=1 Tax=Priestia koreensis TaxID=284581 RepID=UPI003015F760